MAVVARFFVHSINRKMTTKRVVDPETGEDRRQKEEIRNVRLLLVHSNDPNHPNRKAWAAPSLDSRCELEGLRVPAGTEFELDAEYLVTFERVPNSTGR